MGIPGKLASFLDEHKIPYKADTHPEVFTAQQAAQASRVPGGAFAKAVVVNVDGTLRLAVLAATERVDMRRLQECLGAKKVRLASEAEFAPAFPDCDIGAMPIFGSAYGIPVLVAKELTENAEIAFTAGTHRDVVRVKMKDFLDAERPKVYDREALLAGTP